jgi:hypothetical protein
MREGVSSPRCFELVSPDTLNCLENLMPDRLSHFLPKSIEFEQKILGGLDH